MRFLFLTFSFLWSSILLAAEPPAVLDLRDQDWTKPIELRGTFDFYWMTMESDLDALGSYPSQKVRFPDIWTNVSFDGEQLPAFGYATYAARVILPANTRNVGAIVEDMYCAYALYIDGQLVARNGQVGDEDSHRPEWKPQKVDIPSRGDTLELVLQISNYEHSKSGSLEPILVGAPEVINILYRNQVAYDLILTGCLLMGGLFFLGLYLFGRNEEAILYFSLFCLTYSYRIIGAGHYVLHGLLENYPWWLATRLEYLCLFASVFFFAQFVIRLYPEDTSKWSIKFVAICCGLSTLATVLLPPYYFSQIIAPFFGFLLLAFGYTIWIYITAWNRGRPGSFYALVSTLVVLIIFSYNILSYFGLLSASDRISFWGYIGFFFSQSLLLSHKFAYTFKIALEKAQQANQAKTDFLGTISHEIRTPLNAIVGMAHLVMRNDPRQDQMDNMEALTSSAENLTSLINDILDFNKINSGSLSLEELPVDLKEHLEKIVMGYKGQSDAKGVPINLNFDDKVYPHFLADPVRISQVLNNLIGNALKFTSEGQVDVSVRLLEDQKSAQIIDLSVHDTGPGIHKDKMELIFDRFTQASTSTTREFGGTGLGLSIVKGILKLYGSQIKVTSTLGQGSIFAFEIKLQKAKNAPVKKPVKMSEKNSTSENSELLQGKNVLIVEDNLMNMLIAEEFLGRWGMKLDKAANGQEAVDKAKERDYDLILMDLHMPVMDGYEASKIINSSKPDIPILALTASTVAEQEAQIKSAGMIGFVLKPFHPQDLMSKLSQVLAA